MDAIVNSIQANNCYQLSRNVTRIRENSTGVKAILVASNEPCWLITNGASVQKIGNKFRCHVRVRKHTNSLKGEKKYSGCYSSKIAAEIELYSFRLGLERVKNRTVIEKRLVELTTKNRPAEEVLIEDQESENESDLTLPSGASTTSNEKASGSESSITSVNSNTLPITRKHAERK